MNRAEQQITEAGQGLKGVRVAITRAAHQADTQRALLEARGAEVFHYPTIEIVPPRDPAPLDEALRRAAQEEFDWLVVTSINTVQVLAERLRYLALQLPPSLRVAAVGSSTADALREQLDVSVDLMPEKYTGSDLAATMQVAAGTRVFLPISALAKPTLADALRDMGADVRVVDAYRTVVARGGDDVPSMLWEGSIDAITFTSASTVRFFAKRLRYERGTLAMLDDVVVACIGPVTAEAARGFSLKVAVVPDEHTLEGLTAALVNHFQDEAQ
jgi:uroporphyrinogen-III synthase